MRIKKQIVVTDWSKAKKNEGRFLKLFLNADQRRILRGKRISDCNQIMHLQLPREGTLKDGDILTTNHNLLFIEIVAEKESLLEISSKSNLELIKAAYHLGNRHIEVEICKNTLLTKSDNLIEVLLKNFNVDVLKIEKKFFPEKGAFDHD